MTDTCETVKIVALHVPGGHIVINKSDLTDEHVIWTGDKAASDPVEVPAEVVEADGDEQPADAPRRGRPRKS